MALESDCYKNNFQVTIKLKVMKKIFTLLLGSVFSLSLLAYDGTRLSISTVTNNMDLKVEIDGKRFTMQNNSITVGNLSEGSHQLKIYRDKKRNAWGFGRRGEDVIYSSYVYLKRGFHSDILVNRFGKVFVDEQRIDANNDRYNEDDRRYNDQDNNYDNGNNGNNNNGNNNNGWNNGYGNVMNDREFNDIKEQIRKEWFENNRLTSAKVIIDKNNFTTQQVNDLMLLFTFENNRLELAKYAYRKTVDKQSYFQVNDALTYSSSKDELARFIRESR